MTPCDFLKCLFLFYLGNVCQSCPMTFILIICLITAIAVCKTSKPEVSRKSSTAHLHHPDSHKESVPNIIFQKLWPYLKHDLNTFLEELSVKLSNISQILDIKVYLKTFPEKGPTITDVKVSKISDSSKLIMDLNIEFFNTHPILTVMFMTRWKFLKCCFKLQRFEIKGTFRVLFNLRKGDSMLEISSIYISSIEIPSVYASFGNFSELIFIDHFISYLIDQFLEKNLVLPEKVLLFKDESSTDTEYKHQLPQGVLNIAILEARNLMNNDKFSPSPQDVSDPYVMMHIEVDSRTHIFQTQVIKDDLNPVWNYMCQIPLDETSTISDLSLTVMDKDELSKDDPLGTCTVLSENIYDVMKFEENFCTWKQLRINNKFQGELKVFISFSPVAERDSEGLNSQSDGILALFIDSFTDLNVTLYSHPHWRFRATMDDNVILSKSLQFGKNPVFGEKHLFYIKDSSRDKIVITIFNTKDNKSGGHIKLDVSELIQSQFLLNKINSFYLKFESPMYQSKDSTIQIGCQFLFLKHSNETLYLIKARSQILPRGERNLRQISFSKMQSLVQSVQRNKTVLFKLNITIRYCEENSVIFININSLENVGDFKKPKVKKSLKLLEESLFSKSLSLKIKLKNQEKKKDNSIKIRLKSTNEDNDLIIERKVVFRLNKLYFQKSEIIVSIL